MKSYFQELRLINQQTSIKQAQCLALNASAENFNGISQSKEKQNTDRSQNSPSSFYTWRDLSFNVPNQLVKIDDFVVSSKKDSIYNSQTKSPKFDFTRPSTSSFFSTSQNTSSYAQLNSSKRNLIHSHSRKLQEHSHPVNAYLSTHNSKKNFKKDQEIQNYYGLNNKESSRTQTENYDQSCSKAYESKQGRSLSSARSQFKQSVKNTKEQQENQDLVTFLQNQFNEECKKQENDSIDQIESSKSSEQSSQLKINEYKSEEQEREEGVAKEKSKLIKDNIAYINQLYQIQKLAVSAYLKGEKVEKEVIDSHKEIVDPLSSFLENQKRQEKLKYQHEMNQRYFEQSNAIPVYMSHESKVRKGILTDVPPKMFKKKVEKTFSSTPAANNLKLRNSSKEIELVQKEQKALYLKEFLKGERQYFNKMSEMQGSSVQTFQKEIQQIQKFHYEQITEPKTQFLTEKDLKTQKTVHLLSRFDEELKQQELSRQKRMHSFKKDAVSSFKQLQKSHLINQQHQKATLSIQKSLSQRSLMQDNSSKSNLVSQQQIHYNPSILKQHNNLKSSGKILAFSNVNIQTSPNNQYHDNDSKEEVLPNCSQSPSKLKSAVSRKVFLGIQNKQLEVEDGSSKLPFKNKLDKLLNNFEKKQENILRNSDFTSLVSNFDDSIDQMEDIGNEMYQSYSQLFFIPKMTEIQKTCFSLAKWNKFTELNTLLRQNPLLIESRDETGKTMLHWAASRGNLEIIEVLLNLKAKMSAMDSTNKTPKDLAAFHHSANAYNLLVKEEKLLQKQQQIEFIEVTSDD